MAWVLLVVAGLFEVGLVTGLNLSEGFTVLWAGALTLVSGGASFYLLSVAMRGIPAGTAYAVWTGIGAVGGVIAGILFFGETADPLRILALSLIVAGVVGLKLVDSSDKAKVRG